MFHISLDESSKFVALVAVVAAIALSLCLPFCFLLICTRVSLATLSLLASPAVGRDPYVSAGYPA